MTNNFQTFSLGLLILFGRELTERKDAKNVYKLGQGHDITFDKFLTSFLILFPSTVSFFYHSVSFSFFKFHGHKMAVLNFEQNLRIILLVKGLTELT